MWIYVDKNLGSDMSFCDKILHEYAHELEALEIESISNFELRQSANITLVNSNYCIDPNSKFIRSTKYEDVHYSGFPFEGVKFIEGKFYAMKRIPIRIQTPAIFLGYCHDFTNYWHFMTEVLPRIFLIRKLFPKKFNFVCPVNTPNQFVELISTLLDSSPLFIDNSEAYLFEKLLIVRDFRNSNLPDINSNLPNMFTPFKNDLFEIRQELFAFAASKKEIVEKEFNSRLFISRTGIKGRIIRNEELTAARLSEEYSFVKIAPEKLSILEQIAIFNSAQVIVGAGGAALTNLIFCKPGTRVIVQPGTPHELLRRFWRELALLFSLEYHELLPPSPQNADKNIDFNLDGLIQHLDTLL
jgi:hypothetical protein